MSELTDDESVNVVAFEHIRGLENRAQILVDSPRVVWHACVTAPSASPQNVRGRALNSTSILVTWKTPPPESLNGVLTKFRLLYVNTLGDVPGDDEATDEETVHSVDVPPIDSSYVLGGLAKWTPYKLWIAASNSAGEGPLSDVIVVQTDEDGA